MTIFEEHLWESASVSIKMLLIVRFAGNLEVTLGDDIRQKIFKIIFIKPLEYILSSLLSNIKGCMYVTKVDVGDVIIIMVGNITLVGIKKK